MSKQPLKLKMRAGSIQRAMAAVRAAVRAITADPYQGAADHLAKTLKDRGLSPTGRRVAQKSPLFAAPYGVWQFDRGDEVSVTVGVYGHPWTGTVLKRNPEVQRMYVILMHGCDAQVNIHERFMTLRRRANRPHMPTERMVYSNVCRWPVPESWKDATLQPGTTEWESALRPPPGTSESYGAVAADIRSLEVKAVSAFRRDYPEIVEAWEKEQEGLAIAAAGMAMVHDPCYTVQYGDQTECKTCGLKWDTNDQFPPSCLINKE